jgi:hypothetical protein
MPLKVTYVELLKEHYFKNGSHEYQSTLNNIDKFLTCSCLAKKKLYAQTVNKWNEPRIQLTQRNRSHIWNTLRVRMSAPALQFSFSEGRVTSKDYFICESTKICYHCILATNSPKNWTCNLFPGNASTAMTLFTTSSSQNLASNWQKNIKPKMQWRHLFPDLTINNLWKPMTSYAYCT